jgi:hypothetical protein
MQEWKILQGDEYNLNYERMVAFTNNDECKMHNILEEHSQLKKKLNKNRKKIDKFYEKNADDNIDKDNLLLYFSFKDIHHGINILKPNNPSQKLSYKQLFKEIRD